MPLIYIGSVPIAWLTGTSAGHFKPLKSSKVHTFLWLILYARRIVHAYRIENNHIDVIFKILIAQKPPKYIFAVIKISLQRTRKARSY